MREFADRYGVWIRWLVGGVAVLIMTLVLYAHNSELNELRRTDASKADASQVQGMDKRLDRIENKLDGIDSYLREHDGAHR